MMPSVLMASANKEPNRARAQRGRGEREQHKDRQQNSREWASSASMSERWRAQSLRLCAE